MRILFGTFGASRLESTDLEAEKKSRRLDKNHKDSAGHSAFIRASASMQNSRHLAGLLNAHRSWSVSSLPNGSTNSACPLSIEDEKIIEGRHYVHCDVLEKRFQRVFTNLEMEQVS